MQSKNASTEKAILKIGRRFDPKSGTALVCAYENQNVLARTRMSGKNVLEVGCGSLPACFGISNDLMPEKYLATDVSKKLLEASRRIDKRPVYLVKSAMAVSLPDRSFDVIIMRGVLHHLSDPAAALKALKRKLKPGGQLLLYEPNLSSVSAGVMKWILKTFFGINMEESPYGQLSQKSIRQAIQTAKLELADVWYSSLLAFPLTGDYGRRQILPDNGKLFSKVIALDRFLSGWLHKIPVLAKWSHFRVIFLLQNPK
jgi:ubiquinone/menaquinone biosynthesis C-methylase UbiE